MGSVVSVSSIPKLEKNRAGRWSLIVGDRPFAMLAGECHNSSSSSARVFAGAIDSAIELGMNTVLAPVTWELVEPQEGAFDFSGIDIMLELARERGLRLVLLWFGAWKNAQCYYAPAWVKRDTERFARAQMAPGISKVRMADFHNFPYAALSLFCDATREADARAFATLMGHLADVDSENHTVIAIQVENEVGEMAAAREHGSQADAAFAKPVPSSFIEALRTSRADIASDIAANLAQGANAGTWSEVFGESAEEMFTTFYMARYVESVAAAGKSVFPLPMFANCWLDKGHKPGRFPTGGPNVRVMGVWKHVAPSIDFVCPDIYVPTFCSVCDGYARQDNPLAIPETAVHAYAAAREMWTIGHHGAICFAPFGYEDMGAPFDASSGILFGADASDAALRIPQDRGEYAAVTMGLAQLLEIRDGAEHYVVMDAAISECPERSVLDMGAFSVKVSFDSDSLPGACAAVCSDDGVIYLLALRSMVEFISNDPLRPHVDILALEDGEMRDGCWCRDRRLNGDEVAIMHYEKPTLLRAELFAYC